MVLRLVFLNIIESFTHLPFWLLPVRILQHS